MRFGKKRKNLDIIQKTFFTFFPITINGETRWLEKITIEKQWSHLFKRFETIRFLKNTVKYLKTNDDYLKIAKNLEFVF